MPFEHRQRVRFHQSDPAGVLFFGRVFELVQATYEDLCRTAGIDIDGLMRQSTHTTPVIHAEADYRRAIRVGEEVVVRAEIERLGTTSITLLYNVVGLDGESRATVRVVHVFVDADTWRKVAIPADVRNRLVPFATSTEAAPSTGAREPSG